MLYRNFRSNLRKNIFTISRNYAKITKKNNVFYKVTNLEEIHFDHKYSDGLNTLKGKFANRGSCVPGGFYFTDKQNIHDYYNHGVWIREIKLPVDNPNFKIVKKLLHTPAVFDGRNIYDKTEMKQLGFNYFCIGVNTSNPVELSLAKAAALKVF